MRYVTRPPSLALAPYVECLWLLDAPANLGSSDPEIILPDGKTELIIHFGDRFERIGEGRGTELQARTLLTGQLSRRMILRASGRTGMAAVRFRPGGAARFFALPFSEISDQVPALEALLGGAALSLEEELLNTEDDQARLDVLEAFLLRRLAAREAKDDLVRHACRFIALAAWECKVTHLAARIGLSERQLERRFRAEVGLSPKLLARIIRFQGFMERAHSGKVASLTQAALDCGYFDQAHFIRDFRAFAGSSPSAYFSQANALNAVLSAPG